MPATTSHLVSICSLLVTLGSCQSGESPLPIPAMASLIDGTWQRDCQPLTDTDQSNRIMLKFQFGRQFERLEYVFLDRDCQMPAYELRYQGRYELTVTWESYEYTLDFWVEERELAGISRVWIAKANAAQYCGRNDWETALSRPVSLLLEDSCPLQFLASDYHQNLIEVNDDQLIFAAPFQPGRVIEPMIDAGRKELQFIRVGV